MGWKPVPAEKVKPPLIDECPVQMECQVKEIIPLGSHDLFLGQIVALHVKEEVQKEKGRIDITKVLLLSICPGGLMSIWNLGKMHRPLRFYQEGKAMIIDCHTHIFPDEVRKDREAFCKRDEGFSSIYKNSKARMAGVEDLIASMDE